MNQVVVEFQSGVYPMDITGFAMHNCGLRMFKVVLEKCWGLEVRFAYGKFDFQFHSLGVQWAV